MRLSLKIPLYQQLPDLRVQLVHLGVAGRPGRFAPTGKRACHILNRLALPRRDHRVVDAVLGSQLRQRQITSNATFTLKSAQ